MLIDRPIADRPAQAVGSIAIAGVIAGPAAPEPVAFESAPLVPVAVGPGRTAAPPVHVTEPEHDVTEFPIQPSKVQRPTLRESTLRRDRLLDWLHAKIHHRVVFVTAEAGYGKTTLLADFARRTRLRTLWYRLDEEDADWISVLNYIVAAGRAIEPGFAPTTRDLLRDIGSGSRTRDAIVDTFVRELAALGDSGAVLILDDYHLVDHSPDVRSLMREIVARAPERLTLVFSARRRPTIPVARLRALGELVELRTEELRFDDGETERLFRDAYGTPLEPDVLADLNRRTEGWAASLQLVQTAIRDRSKAEIRAFVRSLSGAQSELHDYLAEEVIGDLEPELQSFLMSTSILQSVEPDLAAVAAEVDVDRAAALADEAAAIGLLPVDRRRDAPRYHPLVRDFLEARLRREIGPRHVADLHLSVARAAEARAWRTAAHHYLAAGDLASVHRVLGSSTRAILGGGEFAQAESYIDALDALPANPAFDMIRSRMDLHRDQVPLAVERARAAAAAFPPESTDPQAHMALANLMSVEFYAGNLDVALSLAQTIARRASEPTISSIGSATEAMLIASTDGDLEEFRRRLLAMRAEHEQTHDVYYLGITELNLASLAKACGDATEALACAQQAIETLERGSAGHELPSAFLVRAWSLAHLGRWDEASDDIERALHAPHALTRAHSLVEAADIYDWYASPFKADSLLTVSAPLSEELPDIWAVSRAQNLLSLGRRDEAESAIEAADSDALSAELGHKSRHLFVSALLARLEGKGDALRSTERLIQHSHAQRAHLWERVGHVLAASQGTSEEWSSAVGLLLLEDAPKINLLANVVAGRLGDLRDEVQAVLLAEVRRRAEKWGLPLRDAVVRSGRANRLAAAAILDETGQPEDIALLKRLSRELGKAGGPRFGNRLARRLAHRVFVEDLGRVSIRIGPRIVPGTDVRRKVLALLCLLITRPDLAATRDQVLEALWPEGEPEVAANSLNQTVYFLRRVFEPAYRDEVSPEYVHHDSDVLWLDQELVDSRSRECHRLIEMASHELEESRIDAVSQHYQGRFALDFAYEDWAAGYRDQLHAAYLEVVESAIREETKKGALPRAIRLARRAVEVDPEAEHLEVSLFRLYRLHGAHAAAAEQYGHYSNRAEDDSDPGPTTIMDS